MEQQFETVEPSAQVIASIIKDHFKPQIITVEGQKGRPATEVLILPDGKGLNAKSVKAFGDEYRDRPERREGTAHFTDLKSFVAHVVRFKDDGSALFADDSRDKPSITAVLDYHKIGAESAPRFGRHKSFYSFPLSEEWKKWREVDDCELDQIEFAEFIEDRITDVMMPPDSLISGVREQEPTDGSGDNDQALLDLVQKIGGRVCGPSKLMELSKGMKVHDQQKVKQVINTSTGESQIQFETEHLDADGAPMKVPNLFLLAIPVFHNGPLYRVPVRLRYRVRSGSIKWKVQMHRPDMSLDHAFSESCHKAETDIGLPLFFGKPE
jgi:hypothetical protein